MITNERKLRKVTKWCHCKNVHPKCVNWWFIGYFSRIFCSSQFRRSIFNFSIARAEISSHCRSDEGWILQTVSIIKLEMARQRPTRIPTSNVWPRCAPGLVMGPCIVEIDRIVIREVQYQLEVNWCRNEEVIVKGNFGWVWPMWAGRPRVGNGAMHSWDWPYCHKRSSVSIWSESV